MVEPHTTFRIADLPPIDPYKLASGLVVPRPIGWIGTRSAEGPTIWRPIRSSTWSATTRSMPRSPGWRWGDPKDSLDNVRAVPEFTINIVTAETVEAMNATAASLPAEDDEFEHAGLTKVASTEISPMRVGEATATMECRVTDIVHVGDPEGGNGLVIGEIVVIHVADRVLDGTRVKQDELRAIGRHAGSWYSHATDLFAIDRPA